MTPNPPSNERQLQKLQSKPRLLLWFVAAASSAILIERLVMWLIFNFTSNKAWGLDIPTMLSIAGAAYAIAQWGLARFQATAQILEGLKKQIEELQKELKELKSATAEQAKIITEMRAKAEYLELRIDFNDARINASQQK